MGMGYFKQCKYCDDDVYLSDDEDGQWHAYDDEDCQSFHSCRPKEFEVECKWCGEDIMLRQVSNGKWTPTELDGLHHFCDRKQEETEQEELKK
jgi:hypothetical protein